MEKRRIRIFDTTLRDGEQSPGVSLTPQQKLSVARRLDALGVDAIEAGFPMVSPGEMKAVGMIASSGLMADVYGLARTDRDDIDAVRGAGLSCAHIFIATSDMHLRDKLGITRDDAIKSIVDGVSYAKAFGMNVEFSAEDATRTDRKFLLEAYVAAVKAGADTINIPDTVGAATPAYMSQITRDVMPVVGVPVSVHCHNDFGLATANTIAGIEAGATCAQVTINGVGERAGNAALEEVVMAIKHLPFGTEYDTRIDSRMIYGISVHVSSVFGMAVQPNKALVGENAFAHEAGIHTHGVINNPLTYEPIGPETIGRTRELVVGKHAGSHGLSAVLSENGFEASDEQTKAILERVKSLADGGVRVTMPELARIAEGVIRA